MPIGFGSQLITGALAGLAGRDFNKANKSTLRHYEANTARDLSTYNQSLDRAISQYNPGKFEFSGRLDPGFQHRAQQSAALLQQNFGARGLFGSSTGSGIANQHFLQLYNNSLDTQYQRERDQFGINEGVQSNQYQFGVANANSSYAASTNRHDSIAGAQFGNIADSYAAKIQALGTTNTAFQNYTPRPRIPKPTAPATGGVG